MASIGYGAIWIGILEGCAEAIAGLTKGWFGQWSDNRGMRLPFVRMGYLISSLSKPMLAFFASGPWALLMRSSDRLGKGIRTGARDAMLADQVTDEKRGKVFGFHRAMDTLGAVIGPVLALIWLSFHKGKGYKSLFYFAFIPGLISVSLLFLIKEKKILKTKSNLPPSPFTAFSYWKKASPQYRKLVGGLIAFALFNSSDMFLLLIVKNIFNHGVYLNHASYLVSADMLVISFYVFYNIVYSLAAFPAGILSDKFGPKRMMLIGFVCFTLSYGGIALASWGVISNLWFVLLCFLVYGLYGACTDGISKAWISTLCEKEHKGVALGLFSGFQSIAVLIASVSAGLIWTFFNPYVVFLSAAIMSGILVFFITFALKSPRVIQHQSN